MIKNKKIPETVIFYGAMAAFVFIYCKFRICYDSGDMPKNYSETFKNMEHSVITTTFIPVTTSSDTITKIVSVTTVRRETGDDEID